MNCFRGDLFANLLKIQELTKKKEKILTTCEAVSEYLATSQGVAQGIPEKSLFLPQIGHDDRRIVSFKNL